jgi:DNA-binding NarL/FixJ family response regulator
MLRQVILGEDEFVDSLADHLKKHKHVSEIPRSQRYANRPLLDKIFNESILKDRKKRDRKMVEAIEKYGYRQSEIARHLGLHTSTVSNLVRSRT